MTDVFILPKRIGRFLEVDADGFIIPDVSLDHIAGPWSSVTEATVDSLRKLDPAVSVFIRGSVPRGLAIPEVSDIDFIYISELDLSDEETALENEIVAKFPFVRGVELSGLNSARLYEVHAPQTRPYFQMLLKTQSVCLIGDDFTKNIEPFRPGIEMASHVFSLKQEFEQLPVWLDEAKTSRDPNEVRSTRQWFCRRVVRAGLEVTMGRRSRFTRDLYLCYEQFAETYPAMAKTMYEVLENCLNGHRDPLDYTELIGFLTEESKQLYASPARTI